MDKYLNTKQGSLEESVLEIWKEAANITEKKLDPVGKEDDDVDNDGDVDDSDKYLAKRRKAITKAMKEHKGTKPHKHPHEEGEVEEKLEDSPNDANSQHLCAKNVVHEEWGDGECIPTMHDEPDEEGNIGWYDVMFEHGLEKGVAINELKVTHSEMHHNHKKKKNDEEVDEGIAGIVAKGAAKLAGRGVKALAKKAGQAARERITTSGKADRAERKVAKATKKAADKERLATARQKLSNIKKGKLATARQKLSNIKKGKSKTESYEMGTDEYRKHTQSITPGQDVTDFQNFKVESMKEALAKVWGKAGDELEEYVTKDGMRKRVAEGDKRRTENKDTGKGGKTMTGKTSDVINLKPTTEEVDLDEGRFIMTPKQAQALLDTHADELRDKPRLSKLTFSPKELQDLVKKHKDLKDLFGKTAMKKGASYDTQKVAALAKTGREKGKYKTIGPDGKIEEEVKLDEAMSKDMALKILSMTKNQDFKIASGDRAPMIYLSNDDRDELKKEFGRLGRDVPGPNKGATVMQIVNLAHSGNDRKPFDTEGGKHMISWDKGGKKIGTPKKVSDAAKLAGLKLEEVELDEVAPLVGMAAKTLAKGALMGVGSKVAKKAMGEKMLAADYMIKSGKSAEEVADVANVDVEEIKKVMAAYHENDEKHYKEYLAAACGGGTGLGTTSMFT